jgi:muramoyltetrapeptide carboxypeptidase
MQKMYLATLVFLTSLFADPTTMYPPPLQKGDLIALVFPASFLDAENDKAKQILQSKSEWLQHQGFRTIFYPTQIRRIGYLAGTDEERAKHLMDAWKNKEVKAIWCFRGGYGSQRILDYLDYEYIKQHPKIFLGMSDITALHEAIRQKTGLVTFLAPVLNFFNEKENKFDDVYAFSSFKNLLIDQKLGEIPLAPNTELEILRPGKAKGQLVGGNLSLVVSLCGTKWQMNTKGKILILEDVSEDIYSVDKMLWQLKNSGLLDEPAAVILGSWIDCKPIFTHSLTLDQVFNHYFENASYPVIKGFPSGHDKYQTTLPLNTLIEIDTVTKKVTLLEPLLKIWPNLDTQFADT